jgi:protoporphyrinogen oxidase
VPDGQRTIVVLGAGLAGLRAAYEMAQRGDSVELLEKHDEAGGMARSHEHMGYVFDHGPHGFWSRDEWINEEFKGLVESEGGYNWLSKWSQIHYREEYFNFPLKVSDIISKMPPWMVLHAFLSFLWSRFRLKITRRQPITTEDYLIDQFGQVLYKVFFGPYTRRVWDVDPKTLDVDFARDRVPSLHLWDTLRKLFTNPSKEQMRVTPSGRLITHDLHTFYYPKRGAGALPQSYVRRLTEMGVRFRYGVTLRGIDLATKTVTGTSHGAAFSLAYDGLVSSPRRRPRSAISPVASATARSSS